MEDILYKAVMAYIAANTTPITAKGLTIPVRQGWWEDQVGDALRNKENAALPFDCPAIFYQFSPTRYHTENNGRVKATGELTLHLVQNRIGMDGIKGAEAEAQYNLALQYAGCLVQILHGVKQSCAATLYLATIDRDHTNSPVLHEKIIFSWTATKKTSNF